MKLKKQAKKKLKLKINPSADPVFDGRVNLYRDGNPHCQWEYGTISGYARLGIGPRHYCREFFFDYYKRKKDWMFYRVRNSVFLKIVVKLIKNVENRLGLTNRQRAKFYLLNPVNLLASRYKKVILIKLNWWKPRLRAELFSIFLRAAVKCNTSSIKRAMRYRYLNLTKKHVLKFLDGFVNLNKRTFYGWVDAFNCHFDAYYELIK